MIAFVLDPKSGVPFYRQIIDQVQCAIADGRLETGSQLPTVRQLAVDLKINPNTVARAYQELEIRGIVSTQMGSGTFIGDAAVELSPDDRRRILDQLCTELVARASAYGFSIEEIVSELQQRSSMEVR
ncbi:MAG: GntR family transcriptional regulator [Verrucomicrobiota bacterium]|jgi:GntR family transcriptional regulator|nr:GntR family transcriptional regulator [Verrucomicrobiota bacterium]